MDGFDCGVKDYNDFIVHDAAHYTNEHISSVHLLLDRETQDVLGYVALLTDSFRLDAEEKKRTNLHDIPFSIVPAMKIGKLAVSQKHSGMKIGSYLLWLSLGFAEMLNETGIACRFITVDADVEFDESTPEFYLRNGFEFNEHRDYQSRTKNKSMRYDMFTE